MAGRIEDYAIIGDTSTVALVDRSGSIDWWCAPRVDSGAAFAALLGTKDNGRWLIAPKDEVTTTSRRYEPETLVLETVFETPAGSVAVTDFMPPEHVDPTIHRIVEGRGGVVNMEMELIVRFDYGSVTPWVTATGGVRGERRLTEFELAFLPGYEGSKPVRVGNQASTQFQLDVFGEVMDSALTSARNALSGESGFDQDLMLALMDHLETKWDQPDDGIWEVRGPRRHFTHSKVMAWVAFDRAIKLAEHHHALPLDRVEQWTNVRDRVHADVCAKGFDADLNSFTQYYGSKLLDASLLMLALVGFLPPDDPRIVGTVAAVQKGLVQDGFVRRYQTEGNDVDGLTGSEGAFLMTTFWLADNLALVGRRDEAKEVFERLRGLCNDVGLLSEEYDPVAGRMLGNFPQAFFHVALINTAANLSFGDRGPSATRSAS